MSEDTLKTVPAVAGIDRPIRDLNDRPRNPSKSPIGKKDREDR
jgi:hypothetical protein